MDSVANGKLLRCEGVSKAFGGVRALSGVSVALPGTGITALIGPNGAGKTTLVSVLTGFIRPEAGRCFVGDRETTRLAPHRIVRLGIARTFQDVRLVLRLSVLENVMLARQNQRGETLLGALLRVGVGTQEKQWCAEGMGMLKDIELDQDASRPAGELSFGQQKLLTLACCLATGARTLLLDEPIAGVHPRMASRILKLLQDLRRRGSNITFIEHDMSAVREVADYVILMNEGRVVTQGPTNEVLNSEAVREAYLG